MRLIRLLAIVVAIAGLTLVTRPYVRGLSFVIRAADMQGTGRRLADLHSIATHERDIPMQMPQGSMRGRVYEPEGGATRAALLVSGLHAAGIDEPRLVRMARLLASNGIAIVTPDIPELSRFDVSPMLTDAIEHAALWLANDSGLAPTRRVGLLGISFSGGLSIIAAGRPSLADRVSHVVAFGGHDDLPRVLRFLCTGQEPFPPGQARINLDAAGAGSAGNTGQPFIRAPHDYGVAVMLLGAADRVVPAAQTDALREAVRQYLWASALDGGVDKSRAPAAFETLNARIARLPEPSKTLMRYVVARDVVHLGARLRPYINGYVSAPALSVSKSPKPTVPVFLLHGTDDNIIPSVESEYLAEDLRGHAPVRLLLSGLISRAEADRPVNVADVLQLAGFWGDLLAR